MPNSNNLSSLGIGNINYSKASVYVKITQKLETSELTLALALLDQLLFPPSLFLWSSCVCIGRCH